MTTVVVAGYLLRHPAAGNLLASFQYVLGLDRLGLEVIYLEESGWPYSSYDLATQRWVEHPAAGLRTTRALVEQHCPGVRVVWVDRDSGRVDGAQRAELADLLASADLLLDVGGLCWLPELALCRRRALVDMDPLFTQVGGFASGVLGEYDLHFTYGTRVGTEGCGVPARGLDWLPTLPPVVLDLWAAEQPAGRAWTTVASWGAYGAVEHEGRRYGQKDEEFARLLDLPSRVAVPLELALSGGHEVRPLLRAHGWSVLDAGGVSRDTAAYASYVRGSRGELSAAKNAYVATHSGWFSDRTAGYLAAGRPAVVQDTGCRAVPAGDGLRMFDDVAGAARALHEVEADRAGAEQAARALAREVLAHDVVLPRLLDRALDAPVAGRAR